MEALRRAEAPHGHSSDEQSPSCGSLESGLEVHGLAVQFGNPGRQRQHIFSCAGEAERTARAAHDDRLAASLLQGGLPAFVDGWYRAPMWAGLRARPGFDRIVQLRASTGAAR